MLNREDICPCKGCIDRYVGCHSSCEKYGSWKEEHEQKRKDKYESKKADNIMHQYVVKTLRKYKNKKI